ncbi:MAG TPA: FAD-dependent thymidylate synthase [Candidatus Omnitrophota bacterium]|nr:FAD-dependent thymidylate synthase [Candidatus Omnitrophota bacterium]
MSQTQLDVKLLEVTDNALAIIYAACRQCYSDKFAGDIFDDGSADPGKAGEFIRKVVASGHESPLEHAKFTFAIQGVSRALTHQLVRHRIASFCLTGDTIIKGARNDSARSYKKYTLKSLYERMLTPHGRSRLKLIRLNAYDEQGKVFDRGKIKTILYTGRQMVWRVKLTNGQSIKATINHRFLTRDGWLPLEDIIRVRPQLGVNGIACRHPSFAVLRNRQWLEEQYSLKNLKQETIAKLIGCSGHTVRSWVFKHGLQKEIGGLHGHPPNRGYHWKLNRNRTLEEKKAISERMKGPRNPMWKGGVTRLDVTLRKMVSPEVRKDIYRRDGFQCRLCKQVGGRLTLHHRVPLYVNPVDPADTDNLVTLCRKCHFKVNNHEMEYMNIFGIDPIPYHARSSGCFRVIKWVEIASIECAGIEDTYDIEMQAPHHNFVANGFVVHNSQQSQRYVKESQFDYIIPPSIEKDPRKKEVFLQTMKEIQEQYNKLLALYKEGGQQGEVANQDARFVLPQAAETKIVVSMNCRELLHFFKHRCCVRAQWEIRALAGRMLAMAREKLPEIFGAAGAKCESLGYCPEGEKFSCGKYPSKDKVLKV